MSGKWIAFLIWTFFVAACLAFAGIWATRDMVYTGTNIQFQTDRILQIEAETVTFEAASAGFFVLRKESGETIVGVPKQPPLGWSSNQYFVAAPQEIPGGMWLFPDGNATVKISSDKTVTVRAIQPNPSSLWSLLGLLALITWLIAIHLAA